ncbi:MAG: nucleotidyltransferase [Clostridiales bacterium]|nr:nucleotidyltransferase [Clostridiales bacterium]
MKKPTLVVMAAGMGSRYGGLKQIDPVGPNGEIIIDYSIYDALKAGFGKVVFIIKRELEQTFREVIGNKISKYIDVEFVYQELTALPEGYSVPEGRVKPWGTGHAVLSAKNAIDGPFAVVNADDFYGSGAFEALAAFLSNVDCCAFPARFALAGYIIENTLTENGTVARGVCEINNNNHMTDIVERTKIKSFPDGPKYTEDDGATWHDIPSGSIVSMNTWGFTPAFMDSLEEGFPAFLDKTISTNPLKGEYFLPSVVNSMIKNGTAEVTVLKTEERWYGVTYREDKPTVKAAIAKMIENGKYPEILWK